MRKYSISVGWLVLQCIGMLYLNDRRGVVEKMRKKGYD